MLEVAVLVIVAILFSVFNALILLEIQKTLHRILLKIEKNGLLLTAANEKLDGFATSIGSAGANQLNVGKRFDALEIPRKKSGKRTQELKALLDGLESGSLPKSTQASHEDRTPRRGYEPAREAAMAALAKSWRRE